MSKVVSAPPFPEKGSLAGEKWLCSYANDLKPCHRPAVWMIEVGDLRLGSCGQHRGAITETVLPRIRVWDMRWLTGE